MPDIKELIQNVETALSELKIALKLDEENNSELMTNQKSNEELFEELNIRF